MADQPLVTTLTARRGRRRRRRINSPEPPGRVRRVDTVARCLMTLGLGILLGDRVFVPWALDQCPEEYAKGGPEEHGSDNL